MRGTSINDGWISSILSWLLHGLCAVVHTLSLEGPGSKPVLEILKSLQALSSTNDLRGVVASEESIWSFSHLLGSYTETHHGVVDDTIVLERPQVVQLLLALVLMWRKAKNTVRFLSKTLRLVKGQELEVGALISFELHFQINLSEAIRLSIRILERLDTAIVLPNESLQLG